MQTALAVARPNDDVCLSGTDICLAGTDPTTNGPRARQRHNEQVGGGYFVFRRGTTTGRIKTGFIRRGALPFEHPDFESAHREACRLAELYGGKYDVFAFAGSVSNGPHHGGRTGGNLHA